MTRFLSSFGISLVMMIPEPATFVLFLGTTGVLAVSAVWHACRALAAAPSTESLPVQASASL